VSAPEPGAWVVVREHITAPLALLMAGGGSRVEACGSPRSSPREVQRVTERGTR
jgi:hypothetical protein